MIPPSFQYHAPGSVDEAVALLSQYGWSEANSGKRTQLSRSLRPNLRGLFDTHGNVWEWCHDWYSFRRDVNAEDPFGPPAGSSRVLRGGGWSLNASYCRSANRGNYQPTLPEHLQRFSCCVGCSVSQSSLVL